MTAGGRSVVGRGAPAAARLVTAAESEQAQRRAAGALCARGFGAGDRVALIAASSPAYLAVALGALRMGVVPVLLHADLLPAEQEALLDDARPGAVLRDADLEALAASEDEAELAPWPLARPMLYTSGTTGAPKGVYTGVLDERDAALLLAEERELWGFAADDLHLVASPLYHSAPLRFAGGTLLAGGSVLLPGRFEATAFAAAIAEHRPTTAFVVPAHLQRLAALGGLPSMASFRRLVHAGSACPESLKRHWLELVPDGALWEFYGSTEGQFTACSPGEWAARPGTVGRARPGRELAVDDDGTIWCRTPPHARFAYWRDPVKTALAWRGDAFTVGDLGRIDDDGYLFLDGRRDDLVITGGVNVYPLEVERALLAHPDVREAVVFGVDDEQWGQRVCAAVVGGVDGGVDGEALRDWVREQVAPHKVPKEIVVLDAIPVSSMGKVRRSQLAQALGF